MKKWLTFIAFALTFTLLGCEKQTNGSVDTLGFTAPTKITIDLNAAVEKELSLANTGMTPREISAELSFPKSTQKTFANRGYYGTLNITHKIFLNMATRTVGIKDFLLSDDIEIEGSKIELVRFFALLEIPKGKFNIVTP